MVTEKAVLAGGCFWGMEELFRKLPGVTATVVGYTGDRTSNPTYKDLKASDTGHAEAIEITFDPSQLSYRSLLEFFFQIHDPTTLNRQGNDIGSSYRSALFYQNDEQKKTAEQLIADMTAAHVWPGPIVTEVVPAGTFYKAEDYHQDYLQKNPGGYTCHYIRPNRTLAPKEKSA